ncbi:uncharacterized protein LOC144624019 [Crassostrea virginica]
MLFYATEVLLVFLSLLTFIETSDICHKPNWNNNVNGKKLSEFPIKIFENVGPQSCFRECQAHGNCFSANYDRKQLTCQLLNKTKNQPKPLTDDENFVYMEMTDTVSAGGKTCGDILCNNYSTCIRTSSQKTTCIETDCAEPYPVLNNGIISNRTFGPISATYSCSPGFTGVGQGNRITCRPGGQWSPLSYSCEPPGTSICDFESNYESSCFLTESTYDVFNWTRLSGRTNSTNTGPSGALIGSYYKYIETSVPREPGDNATMVSNLVFEAKSYCLSFYYHMYGSGMGTLMIQTQTGSQNPATLWMLSGNQGNTWHSLKNLTIPLDQDTKILIQGIRGSNWTSDISLDYVVLLPYACP